MQKEFSPDVKTFIVSKIKYEVTKDEATRVYYKNLRTIDRSMLPIFVEPPLLNILDYGNVSISIVKNTNEYFEYTINSYLDVGEGKTYDSPRTFDLMITKYK